MSWFDHHLSRDGRWVRNRRQSPMPGLVAAVILSSQPGMRRAVGAMLILGAGLIGAIVLSAWVSSKVAPPEPQGIGTLSAPHVEPRAVHKTEHHGRHRSRR